MSGFENLRVVDNFCQTSLFFPLPTAVISIMCEDGKDYYAMLLSCRNSSNTAQNILQNGKCALNFVDDKTFKEYVRLSWPGDKPEDKIRIFYQFSRQTPLILFLTLAKL